MEVDTRAEKHKQQESGRMKEVLTNEKRLTCKMQRQSMSAEVQNKGKINVAALPIGSEDRCWRRPRLRMPH